MVMGILKQTNDIHESGGEVHGEQHPQDLPPHHHLHLQGPCLGEEHAGSDNDNDYDQKNPLIYNNTHPVMAYSVREAGPVYL